jgi:hypothetical protein
MATSTVASYFVTEVCFARRTASSGVYRLLQVDLLGRGPVGLAALRHGVPLLCCGQQSW